MASPRGNKPDLTMLKEKLGLYGLKATSQRLIIYQSLIMNFEHPSAEMIYEKIHKKNPSISLATVYKTLESLVKAGLAKKVKTGDDVFRFDHKSENHNHLYCSNTNQIIDYEDEELNLILKKYFELKKFENFVLTDFQLQINGEIIDNKKTITTAHSK